MAAERRDEDGRELRLEGLGLIVTGGVLIALLAGAFYLGRWVERQSGPVATEVGASQGEGPLAVVPGGEPPAAVEVDGGSDIFDSADVGRVEPGRQALGDADTAKREEAPLGADVKPTAGDFFVQVFAGRDRASAETLVDELRRGGYGVKVVSERDGGESVFKVRVGGYPTRDQAVDAAQTLKKAGYSTWVTSDG